MKKSSSLVIEKPAEKPRKKVHPLMDLFGFAILAASLFGIFLLIQEAVRPVPFRITRVSGTPEIYSAKKQAWVEAKTGDLIFPEDKVRTSEKAEMDIQVSGQVNVRLEPKSTLKGKGPSAIQRDLNYQLQLLKGAVLGATGRKFKGEGNLEIATPVAVGAIRGTVFRIEANRELQQSWVGVLRGAVEVKSLLHPDLKAVKVKPLQKTLMGEAVSDGPSSVVTEEEWGKIADAYDLIPRAADFQAQQKDLAKQAGNLFEKVFDHGDFFTPREGHATREFVLQENPRMVTMELSLDVFPPKSFVGMYMKTRGLDLSDFQYLEFDVRQLPGQEGSGQFLMDFKSELGVLKTFVFNDINNEWRTIRLPIHEPAPMQVSEIIIYMTHKKAGEHKTGILEFKDFDLIPMLRPPKDEPGGKK